MLENLSKKEKHSMKLTLKILLSVSSCKMLGGGTAMSGDGKSSGDD